MQRTAWKLVFDSKPHAKTTAFSKIAILWIFITAPSKERHNHIFQGPFLPSSASRFLPCSSLKTKWFMDFQWPATLGSPFADAIAVCLRASGAGSALLRPRTSHSLLVFPAVSGTESAQWESNSFIFLSARFQQGGWGSCGRVPRSASHHSF